jgi:hypothetical protein
MDGEARHGPAHLHVELKLVEKIQLHQIEGQQGSPFAGFSAVGGRKFPTIAQEIERITNAQINIGGDPMYGGGAIACRDPGVE